MPEGINNKFSEIKYNIYSKKNSNQNDTNIFEKDELCDTGLDNSDYSREQVLENSDLSDMEKLQLLQESRKMQVENDSLINITSDEKNNCVDSFSILYDSINQQKVDEKTENESNVEINKIIDESHQGEKGDCWLLSGLNGFSYSSKGAKLIKDSITMKNNKYKVRLEGINTTITITKDDLVKANKNNTYAKGDGDVLLMELVFEKAFEKIENGEIEVDRTFEVMTKHAENESILSGGSLAYVVYMLTGDKSIEKVNRFFNDNSVSESDINSVKEDFEEVYDKLENNPDNTVGQILFKGSSDDEIIDIDGEKHKGLNSHSWSIKHVDGDNVTIVNPWDSSKDITVKKDEILKYAISLTYYEFE